MSSPQQSGGRKFGNRTMLRRRGFAEALYGFLNPRTSSRQVF
jgi:hypothetical protein